MCYYTRNTIFTSLLQRAASTSSAYYPAASRARCTLCTVHCALGLTIQASIASDSAIPSSTLLPCFVFSVMCLVGFGRTYSISGCPKNQLPPAPSTDPPDLAQGSSWVDNLKATIPSWSARQHGTRRVPCRERVGYLSSALQAGECVAGRLDKEMRAER